MFLNVVCLLLSLSSLVIFGVSDDVKSLEVNTLRLPNETRPISYDLKILTNIHRSEFNFTGSVGIHLVAINRTDRIVVHVKDLNIEEISLTDLTNNIVFKNLVYKYNKAPSFLTVLSRINPLNLTPENEYLLKIIYKSTLNSKHKGFYRTSYNDSKNNTIWLATTQFQSTYARRAFPCYDEPAIKAKFTITIMHGSNYSAISNMPIDGEPTESKDGMTTTKFLETPQMSTYNVAFAVSNFQNIAGQKDNITQRIFYPPESENKGKFALETAQEALHELQNYFNVDYPLPKLDHIGVPKRIGMAMENWGLIIYREEVILPRFANSNPASTGTRVITHEVAHQWFGNLVTLKWWTYVWLNEGFATHYGNKAIQLIYPYWNVRDYIMATEQTHIWDDYSSHPLTHYVETEQEISLSFSGATYCKAAHILQMFEHALSETTFQKGVSLYLRKFQYSTVDEDDFFDALQEVATSDSVKFFMEKGTVKRAMKTWTHQKYYPLVTVTRHYENGTFTLQQKSCSEKQEDDLLWYIPITFMSGRDVLVDVDNTKPDFIFPELESIDVDPEVLNRTFLPDDWLILNKKQIGFYRVNYDERNWKLITEALKRNPKSIHAHNRVQLIRDCAFLLLHNQLKASIAFEFLTYIEYEDDPLPWNEAVNALRSIYYELEDTESCELYKKYIGKLVRNKFMWLDYIFTSGQQRLRSVENEPLINVITTRLFEFACYIELDYCVKYAKNKFKDVIDGNVKLEKKVEKIILREGIKVATESDYKIVLRKLASTKEESDRRMLIECLTSSKDISLIRYFLESILDPNVRYTPKERDIVIEYTAQNPDALGVLIEFLKENHHELANLTSSLWKYIAFMRYELQSEGEKQAYLDLLEKVRYLGTLDSNKLDQILTKDYPEFHNEQEELVLTWLQNYLEVSNGNERVDISKEKT